MSHYHYRYKRLVHKTTVQRGNSIECKVLSSRGHIMECMYDIVLIAVCVIISSAFLQDSFLPHKYSIFYLCERHTYGGNHNHRNSMTNNLEEAT